MFSNVHRNRSFLKSIYQFHLREKNVEQQKKYHEFEKNINLPGSAIATANKASKKIEKILEFIFVGIVMKQSIVF